MGYVDGTPPYLPDLKRVAFARGSVQQMRIVMTTDTYWPRVNGVTVAVQTFRRHLMRKGHTVYSPCPQYPANWSGVRIDDPDVYRFPSFRFPLSPETGSATHVATQSARLLERLRPDVVHSHTEFTIGFRGKALLPAGRASPTS